VVGESYQAAYDVLWITRRLESVIDGVTTAEVHLLAYVACLLTIYRRLPATDWGYGFIRSQWGAPFSAAIDGALNGLLGSGFLVSRREVVITSSSGRQFVEFLAGVAEHEWRTQFLDGACSSVLAMPIGSVRDALHQEPSMRRSRVHKQPRTLLGTSEDALYQQFGSLSDVIGLGVADLMIPSVVWLTYLSEMQRLDLERVADETNALDEADRSA
jgi:hypothetical protein